MVNGKAQQDHFDCLEGMRNSHLKNGWAATGQNITIFEDGKIAISLDRNLNRVPAGIRLANAGALCIEIIGCFDKGKDKIIEAQKQSVIHVYACLADKFSIPINSNYIVYHAWYTYSGNRLPDYIPGQSSKSCPGTAFWGQGNTVSAAKRGFLADVRTEYIRVKGNVNVKEDDTMTLEEKQAFKQLQEQVAKLEKKLSMDAIPSYAKEAIDKLTKLKYKNGKPVVDTPNGRSADFYSLVTVLNRAGLFDK